MHYLPGTSFALRPGKKLSLLDSYFEQGVMYLLKKIKPLADGKGVEYFFDTSKNSPVKITFKNCREADKVISLHKGEVVPNYEAKYEQLSNNL